MNVNVVSKTQNTVFNRTEVNATVSDYTSTPSRIEVESALCKELKCEANALVIDQIDQPFGSKTSKIRAKLYSSPEEAKKFEPGYKFQRGKPKAQAKTG